MEDNKNNNETPLNNEIKIETQNVVLEPIIEQPLNISSEEEMEMPALTNSVDTSQNVAEPEIVSETIEIPTEPVTNQVETTNPVVETNEVVLPEPINIMPTLPVEENNDLEKPKKVLSKKTQLIITIIVGLLVLYAGGYTAYYVLIVKNTNPASTFKEKTTLTNEEKLALLEIVPYQLGYAGAYQDIYAASNNIVEDVLASTTIKYMKAHEITTIQSGTDWDQFVSEHCDDKTNCYAMTRANFISTLQQLYGTERNAKFKDYIISSTGRCVSSNNYFYCYEPIATTYTGRISEIIETKEGKDIITIYEQVLFVDTALVTKSETGYKVTINKLYSGTIETTLIGENVSLDSPEENYAKSLFEKYKSNVKIYKHTFTNVQKAQYVWSSTEPVKSTEE